VELRVILKTVRKLAGTDAGRATTQPVALVSVWFAGTGVKAADPLAFLTSVLTVTPKVAGSGQALPAAGFVRAMMSEPVKKSPLKTLTPRTQKFLVSPSLG
jgi:hypothetical protein